MKKGLVLLVVLLAAGCSNPARRETAPATQTTGAPAFEFTEEIYNFGRLQSGEVVVALFRFKNSGKGVLRITRIDSGCGCLAVTAEPENIPPGGSGKLTVTFDTAGLYGNQYKTFLVETDFPGVSKELAVTAEVINENIQFQQ